MKVLITFELEADLIPELRALAEEQGVSLGKLVACQLEGMVRERKTYDRARARALARLQRGYYLHWKRPRKRGDLHER